MSRELRLRLVAAAAALAQLSALWSGASGSRALGAAVLAATCTWIGTGLLDALIETDERNSSSPEHTGAAAGSTG